MSTSDRCLRADVEEFDTEPPKLSKRRQEQRDRIFRLCPLIMARRGTENITLAKLALALDISTASLRRHVIDLEYLLFKLLLAHLQTILAALNDIPPGAPDRAAKLQAAYRALTRDQAGHPTAAHLLLERDRHLLPDDLRGEIEALRATARAIRGPGASPERQPEPSAASVGEMPSPPLPAPAPSGAQRSALPGSGLIVPSRPADAGPSPRTAHG